MDKRRVGSEEREGERQMVEEDREGEREERWLREENTERKGKRTDNGRNRK